MGKIRKISTVLLCFVLVCVCTLPSSATTMSSITSESIQQMQGQISNAQSEKETLNASLKEVQKKVKELKQLKSDLNSYVTKLDASLAEIEAEIASLKSQIAVKEEEIAVTEALLAEAMEIEANQHEAMDARIQFMYQKGESYFVELLLSADSFGDLLNRAVYVNAIAGYDHDRLMEYQETREYIDLCEQQLELEKQFLDEAKAAVEEEQAALETLIAQKEAEIKSYESKISDSEESIEEYEAMIAEQEELISQLEAAVIEEKKQILAANGIVLTYDGGAFKFPIASYTRVSSDYGWRIHPTLGYNKFHNGVDFAAPKGTAIYAAYDGEVVAATYSATMGNYVMINHGDGLYTIYMHASALYCKKGDIVVRGETIAAVGTTGRSTGNHLHFSVRKNGEYVSPWEYISKK